MLIPNEFTGAREREAILLKGNRFGPVSGHTAFTHNASHVFLLHTPTYPSSPPCSNSRKVRSNSSSASASSSAIRRPGELLIFFDCELFCDFHRDLSIPCQYLLFVELQECIHFLDPISHIDRMPAFGLDFRVIEIHGDDTVQVPDLFLVHIILCDGDIPSPDLRTFPLVRPMFGFRASARSAMSSAAVWPDPVANGEDHVEVVIGNATLDRPPAFLLNCQVFLDSCPRLQLSIFEDVPDEEADILLGRLVQLSR